jgi:hypothetical protein
VKEPITEQKMSVTPSETGSFEKSYNPRATLTPGVISNAK